MIQIRETIPKIAKNSVLCHRTDPSCPTGQIRPVSQEERNTIETQSKHTRVSVGKNKLLSEGQKKFIMVKVGCTEEELEKALTVIEKSSPKPKNIMGYLQTSAFFQGECILEPAQEERELSREEQARREEQAAVSVRVEKLTTAMQGSITAALEWYQNLAEPIRAKVQSNIIRMKPDTTIYFEGKKPFGPLMFVLLREQRNQMEGKR